MQQVETKRDTPLYRTIIDIVALWTIFNIGYYLLLPPLGYEINYNSTPFIITGYYLVCCLATVIFFWNTYKKWLRTDASFRTYALISLGLSTVLWLLIYIYSLMPNLHGKSISAYTDILLATPWYFLPKSIEILVQQLLVSVLIIELKHNFHTLKKVVLWYAVCFGSAHIILFFMNGSPIFYSTFMTISAVFSSLLFPYLMLKIRGGFVYAYAIHLLFYILLATLFHAFPPPGYVI